MIYSLVTVIMDELKEKGENYEISVRGLFLALVTENSCECTSAERIPAGKCTGHCSRSGIYPLPLCGGYSYGDAGTALQAESHSLQKTFFVHHRRKPAYSIFNK